MKTIYQITGMTCNNCVASVTDILSKVDGVKQVDIDLGNKLAVIQTENHIPLEAFEDVLPQKYKISKGQKDTSGVIDTVGLGLSDEAKSLSKFQQLKPLVLIFLYLFTASFLLNYEDWNTTNFMLDFMGLFYIVFSFFKLLDLKGFPESFRMYDPLAKLIPTYGRVYPFIELVLGFLFLMRYQINVALVVTILILGTTTIGVTKTLLDKKSIRCACLGTALKLPMTEATFIENFIMLVMAISMLITPFV